MGWRRPRGYRWGVSATSCTSVFESLSARARGRSNRNGRRGQGRHDGGTSAAGAKASCVLYRRHCDVYPHSTPSASSPQQRIRIHPSPSQYFPPPISLRSVNGIDEGAIPGAVGEVVAASASHSVPRGAQPPSLRDARSMGKEGSADDLADVVKRESTKWRARLRLITTPRRAPIARPNPRIVLAPPSCSP
ncbi:hypothetical protein C8R45DRAFT_1029677 [Mycena sanguinolenta]|nr:hypothetical protein C8R45DRAFT_1029677 [Mycena sanguinolenta]